MLSVPFRTLEFSANHLALWIRVLLVASTLLSACNLAYADQPAVLIEQAEDAKSIQVKASVLVHKGQALKLSQVKQLKTETFAPLREETMFNMDPKDQLWLKLDVARDKEARDDWVVWISLPLLDLVTLFYEDKGKLRELRSGDQLPQRLWFERGRYPRFNIEIPEGSSSIYLLIQSGTPISLPLHVGSVETFTSEDKRGMLGLGVMFGLLLTVLVICLVTAYIYADRLYFYYSLYVGLLMLAVSAYTGLAGYLIWPDSASWADAAQGVLAILAGGGAMFFVETLLGGRKFARRLSRALMGLCVLSLPAALAYYFVPRSVGVIILGFYMLSVGFVGLSLAIRAWRRGDQVGKWVFCAYFPLLLAVLLAIVRAYGLISVSWWVQYGVVAALIIEVPFMLLALNTHSRERHEIQTREHALSTQDALTGLLAELIFDDRLKQTTARYAKRKEDAAIVLISLVNYEQISTAYGLPVAEQSVLRAVIKLRKVLRDADTVARVGTSHFGLILEGIGHRSRISEIGARLIAQGLMPLPGLVPEVTLQFHVAALLMRETSQPGLDIKASLLGLLGSMSPRTRRPIRFLEPTSPVTRLPEPSVSVAAIDLEPTSEFAPTMTSPHVPSQDSLPSTQLEDRSDWEKSSGLSVSPAVTTPSARGAAVVTTAASLASQRPA
jgi:two-component system, sensor histidine kinase LadS